jgi:dihydrofolate reductase
MNIIVAVGNNWGIGFQNDLIYNIPADKKFFRNTTMDKVVVMGRKTFMLLPNSQPLKNRTNVVLSHNESFSADGVTVCRSLDELFELVTKYNTEDVFIIGGAEIYKELLPYCSTAYITKINDNKCADKFFPNIDEMNEWKLTDISEDEEYDGIKFRFCTYVRCK